MCYPSSSYYYECIASLSVVIISQNLKSSIFFLKAIFQVNEVNKYPLAIETWTRQRGAFSDLDYLRFSLYLQLSISEAWG